MATAERRLLTRLKELCITRKIRLRIPRTKRWLLAHSRQSGGFIVPVVTHIVPDFISSIHSGFTPVERCRLPELLLRRGDQAEIMLRVLEIVLGGDRISGRLGVARKLQIFVRDVGRRTSYFDIRSVRLIDPGQRIVTLAVSSPHTLVLLVSHD